MDFEIIGTNELITSNTGLVLAGKLLKNFGLTLNSKVKTGTITNSEVLKSYLGMMTLGKSHFDNIELYRKDLFFKQVMGLKKVPSAATLRQRVEQYNIGHIMKLKDENIKLLKGYKELKITAAIDDFVAIDADVSPFDNSNSKKEGVSFTYKKFMGYAPIFAYLGKEGYCINSQLRDGSTHCQKGTTAFLKETIDFAKQIENRRLLLRLDSGNDAIENIALFHNENVHYIVKRNIRRENKDQWLVEAKNCGQLKSSTIEKTVYEGFKITTIEDIDSPVKIAYRISDVRMRHGQQLLFPEIDVESYYTSLDYDVERIVNLYHDHATSEQFHSEIKSDLDLERVPSSKFSSNACVLMLGTIAYNVLRIIGIEMAQFPNSPLRTKVERRRIRTVIQNIMYMASKVVSHARKKWIAVPNASPWFLCFNFLKLKFS